jgi:hypothetical protein
MNVCMNENKNFQFSILIKITLSIGEYSALILARVYNLLEPVKMHKGKNFRV